MLDHSLVNAFVAAADQHDSAASANTRRARSWLNKRPCGESNTTLASGASCFTCLDCAKERLGFHHHSGAAAERPIINLPVPVFGEVTQIVNADLDAASPQPRGELFQSQRPRLKISGKIVMMSNRIPISNWQSSDC